jgi:hypothetical protein
VVFFGVDFNLTGENVNGTVVELKGVKIDREEALDCGRVDGFFIIPSVIAAVRKLEITRN